MNLVDNLRSYIKKEYDLTIPQINSIVEVYCNQSNFKPPGYASNWKPERIDRLKYEFAARGVDFKYFLENIVKKYIPWKKISYA